MRLYWWFRSSCRKTTTIQREIGALLGVCLRLPIGKVTYSYCDEKSCSEGGNGNVFDYATSRDLRLKYPFMLHRESSGYARRVYDIPVWPQEIFDISVPLNLKGPTLNIGIAKYPRTVQYKRHGHDNLVSTPTRVPRWNGSCSYDLTKQREPVRGGLINYLRCHLSCAMLFHTAQRHKLLYRMDDPSGFFGTGDLLSLINHVNKSEYDTIPPGIQESLDGYFCKLTPSERRDIGLFSPEFRGVKAVRNRRNIKIR